MSDNALVPARGRELTALELATPEIRALAERARDYREASTSDATRRAYAADWRDFADWCWEQKAQPLPASAAAVALYLTARAETVAVPTLARRLAAIRRAHRNEGFDPPASADLDQIWAGIRRRHGRPPKRKRALPTDDIRRMVKATPTSLTGLRDRAILLLGFAGVFRRSELAELVLDGPGADPRATRISFVSGGVEVHFGRAKGDQEAKGATIAIPFGRKNCPVAALEAWLSAAGVKSGPVFRRVYRGGRVGLEALCDKTIADIIKQAAERVKIDPALVAGHSLRRGGITAMSAGGADLATLVRQARHAKPETTMGYIEDAHRMTSSPAGKLGL